MSSLSTSTEISCKSCIVCQDIYKHLQVHITAEHILTGSEGVISNVILNLLSLMIPATLATGKSKENQQQQQPCQPIPVPVPIPVIAKQPEKQVDSDSSDVTISSESSSLRIGSASLPPFSQEFSNVPPNEFSSRYNFQPELMSNMFTLPQTKLKLDQQQIQQQPQQPQPPSSMYQPTSKVPMNMNSLFEFPLILPPQDSSNNNNNNQSNGLVNPDGTFTTAGLSMLLSNQNNRGNVTGKSDLDDVADILVNKMPIPSLERKGWDNSNFQLSTFYLQQLALNQLQHALASEPNVNVQNRGGANNSVTARGGSEYNFSSKIDDSLESCSLQQLLERNKKVDESLEDPSGSFQQLLERHKKISGMIAHLNIKTRLEKNSESATISGGEISGYGGLSGNQLLEDTLTSLSASMPSAICSTIASTKSLVPRTILPVPQNLRQLSPPPLNVSSKHKDSNISSPIEPSDLAGRKQLPVILTHHSNNNPTLIRVSSLNQNKSSQPVDDSHVHFAQEKSGGVITSSQATAPPPSLHGLQSLLLETAKRIAMDQEDLTTNKGNLLERNVNVAVTSSNHLISKIPLTTLQGIIVETPKSTNEESVTMETITKVDGNEGDDVNRTYADMTMVPIAEYDTLEDDEQGPSVQSESKPLYTCDKCGVTFSVLSTLQSHVKNNHSAKIEFCNYCQISFTNHEEYYTHVASHRGEENIFSCQFCPKIFTSKGDYKKHTTKHTQKRPYLCNHCQKAFRDPGSLAKHERIHTGEQPFICQICKRGFAEKSSLRKHSRVHSGEKPYKCELCDKSFSISGNLQRHMLIHTGKKPFKCTLCSKAFNNPSHLRRHIKNLHTKSAEKTNTEDIHEYSGDGSNLVVPRDVDMQGETHEENTTK